MSLIPLVVVLWEHVNFGGTKRVFIEDMANLGDGWTKGALNQPGARFNDVASAVGVHPGPDYERWKLEHANQEPTVSLWTDWNYNGYALTLTAGIVADLRPYDMNDKISSVRFNDADPRDTSIIRLPAPAAPIAHIPIVLRLHTAGYAQAARNYGGEADNVMTLVESTVSLREEYGAGFNDCVSWVEVLKGPSWTVNDSVELFKDDGYAGESRLYRPNTDADLVKDGFNDVVSSVRFGGVTTLIRRGILVP